MRVRVLSYPRHFIIWDGIGGRKKAIRDVEAKGQQLALSELPCPNIELGQSKKFKFELVMKVFCQGRRMEHILFNSLFA